ncbi:MAG TPA: interleukin-like EMT inducer domain-containing protein [Caldilineaceae bacterium]|nr:interleukin-like EMT inducer domain-containing protein [Caldilineaceae bacterium]
MLRTPSLPTSDVGAGPADRPAARPVARQTGLRRHLAILALYTLLALALSWPLPAQMTTHVPGIAQWAFDESTFLWNVWYFKHALVDQLASPLHTELIWYPLGIDLILYTYNFFHALLAQPPMLAVNLPFGSNLALLLSTILSGYGVFLLVRYLLGRRWAGGQDLHLGRRLSNDAALLAAFGAGLLYAFGSNRAIYAMLGHYDMVTTQWIPFYALTLLRSLDETIGPARRRQAALWAGVFMALNGLAEMITALFLAIFTLIVLLAVAVGRAKGETAGAPRPTWRTIAGSLALAVGMAVLLWSPALIPILRQFLTDDFSLQGWGEAIPLSVDLLGFFKPTVLHPILGPLFYEDGVAGRVVAELRRVQLRALEQGVAGLRDVNTVFVGWVTLALALAALVRFRRRVRIWAWTVLLFGLFCLGPFLQINGRYRFDLDGVEATFPLPFALLHYLPIIKANRAPNRNSVLLMLGLAVLVGYGLAWLLRRRSAADHRPLWQTPQGWLAATLCGLILFEHLALPLPLSDARVPAVYEQIAADPRPISVMHLPLGWRNSFGVFGPEQTLLQYYQTVHGKPMLGGNISRAPDFKLAYFRRIPLFQVLRDIQFGAEPDPALVEQAKAQAADLLYLYNTGYVLLMPPIPERYPYVDHWQAAWAFVKETLPLEPKPFWSEDGIEAYRVIQPAGRDAFTLDLGEAGAYPYRGEGWDAAETDAPYGVSAIWATGETSRLFLPLRQVDPAARYTIALRAHPFAYPGSPGQSVALVINGEPLPAQPLAEGWQTVEWQAPGHLLLDGLNRLELHWAHQAAPRAVLGGDRSIGSTGVQMPLDVDLKAFAEGGYIALYDEEGNQQDGSAGRRGVNVTLIEPDGTVAEKVGFDTAANDSESDALADYLAQVPDGQIVLVASYGDATAHLSPEAVAGLQGLGASVTLEELQGQYFAIAGIQGARPGSAAVAIGAPEASLTISLNRDRRPLAAAVDWVEIKRE